jgi:signal peptidase I
VIGENEVSAAAVVFSFLATGSGHVLLGRWVRGLVLALAGPLALLIAGALGILPSFAGFVGTFTVVVLLNLFGIFDAWRSRAPAHIPWSRWLLCAAMVAAYAGGVFLLFLARERVLGYGLNSLPSDSMSPTLQRGDILLWDSRAYRGGRDPKDGDVVVFLFPFEENVLYVKRVVAGGGETVAIRGGTLYVSDRPVAEPYLLPDPRGSVRDFGPVTVPAGSFFVMGDNRARSSDSRSWGPVERSKMLGRASCILYGQRDRRIGWAVR